MTPRTSVRRESEGRASRQLTSLLCVHSYFSFGRGVASPRRLVRRAAELGFTALGLMDDASVAGAVELAGSAREAGIQPVFGTTLPVAFKVGRERQVFPLGLIAASRSGYARLNELLTLLGSGQDAVDLDTVLQHGEDLFCLSGPRAGFVTQLLRRRQLQEAQAQLRCLKSVFRDRLFVQLFFDRAPRDRLLAQYLRALAHDLSLPVVAAPEVRLLTADDYPLLDALTCARLGITVTQEHTERPLNAAQHLWTPRDWGRRIPFPEAHANAERLVRECSFELLPKALTPPRAHLPDGLSAFEYLQGRVYEGFVEKYPGEQRREAHERLEEELRVVRHLELEDFFLVAAEITDWCRDHGILAAGRGSAAASVLCYLLGITLIDPLQHGLLFERFLHTGRVQMPDVDIDIGSARRADVIAWVEERFGATTEAMTANRITYRLSSALQDLGRALGLPPEVRDRLTRALGRDYRSLRPHRAREAQEVFDEVLGSAPVKEELLKLLEGMEAGFVRHLAPHSGGVVLSREPLTRYSPLARSSGGIRMLTFDKDDVETLGLIKVDLLGLRMLAALERAREEVLRLTGEWLDFGNLPDDPAVWARIGQGDTLGLFQIESPGQQRLSVQLKPRNMLELAHQVALFRPGPIQSRTVHPYTRRARGLEATPQLSGPLQSILGTTHGVILFQEQILRLAVHYAGMNWTDADRFRKRLGEAEEEAEVSALRERFILGAVRSQGVTPDEAQAVFDECAAFRGFGFAESHAHAFATHAYLSAWVRHHHPAAFLAGVLSEHPGMWPLHSIAHEARRWGVRLLDVDVNRSGVYFRAEDRRSVRLPLCAVENVSEELAREVMMERLSGGPFGSIEDFYGRVNLKRDALEALAKAGAFATFEAQRRRAFYRIRELVSAAPGGTPGLLTLTPDTPPLFELLPAELLYLDHLTKGVSPIGQHFMDLVRGELRAYGCRPLASLQHGEFVRTAGLVIARQKPPTAKGFAFFVLEDGVARLQAMISPALWEAHRQLLRDARVLIVEGTVEQNKHYRGLKVTRLAELPATAPRVRGYEYA
ncbi:DNA polymerase III subunit alpha [Deinococcus peraridilitoris]|uniref:Error-prone DNA polymerase n=1 Tax=Deinococcus peraridilitoris (strain DSM 19664 / LMG 22246 / CIP 109416 / KR-200) TaxID=937777 RepID=L0A5Y9_DEIPD|nr:DNA polymerase III subunit alpha [Deinococcus peraridilitoris]AFZ68435.1 DNA-directed DNA polymerase III PolC [Deinococcus peraridilitoris DSM 19664]